MTISGEMAKSIKGKPTTVVVDYRCPRCKGTLQQLPHAYHCAACEKHFPVVLGIPDFRIFPDPYIDYKDDWEKGRQLAERSSQTDFRGLVEYYWSITPDIPDALVRHYVRHDLAGVERGRRYLQALQADLTHLHIADDSRVLELGCRTGGFLVAAAERDSQVVGIDIAFRWLVVARKRLQEAGRTAQLVCCCAQFLPFQSAVFDLVVAGNVIEHTTDQVQVIQEAHRTVRPGGAFFAATCNRFSVAAEPHVRVWGVGWLPRRWMDRYVRWVRGVPYQYIRLVSLFEIKRMIRRTGFRQCQVKLPGFSEGELEGLPVWIRRVVAIYNRVKDRPLIRQGLLVFGPVLHLICVREKRSG